MAGWEKNTNFKDLLRLWLKFYKNYNFEQKMLMITAWNYSEHGMVTHWNHFYDSLIYNMIDGLFQHQT